MAEKFSKTNKKLENNICSSSFSAEDPHKEPCFQTRTVPCTKACSHVLFEGTILDCMLLRTKFLAARKRATKQYCRWSNFWECLPTQCLWLVSRLQICLETKFSWKDLNLNFLQGVLSEKLSSVFQTSSFPENLIKLFKNIALASQLFSKKISFGEKMLMRIVFEKVL